MAATKRKVTKSASFSERVASVGSGLGGLAGLFSSWTVCHNVCTAAIALLAVIGITVTGMPLLFLQSWAVPLWTAAVVIFAVLLALKLRRMGCISSKALMFNAGLITAGTPFRPFPFNFLFWIIGGSLAIAAAALFIRGKIGTKR